MSEPNPNTASHRPPDKFLELRTRSEALLKKRNREAPDPELNQLNELLHELDVHRIELELQNEELRHTQLELEAARDRYSNLFNSAPIGYVVLDSAGIIRQSNQTWASKIGRDLATLRGMPFADLLINEDAAIFRGRYRSFFRNPAGKRMEVRARLQNTTEALFLQLEAKPNSLSEKPAANINPDELLVVISDVTERKDLQQQREELIQKLTLAKEVAEAASKSKSEFMSVMSHELRTPLTPIVALSEMLIQETEDANLRECMEIIHRSAKNQLALVDDILDFSKIEGGRVKIEIQALPIITFITAIGKPHKLTADAKKIAFITEIDEKLPPVVGADPVRLQQILDNLLANAIKFTHSGEVRLRVENANDVLCFSVRDSGIGIPLEKQVQIFEPFTQGDSSITRSFGGTGLGLTISKSLAQMMGGSITVVSQPNQGSEFFLELPLITVPEIRLQENVDASQRTVNITRTLRILVVEDDPANQQVTKLLLEKDNHFVEVVRDGESALQLLQERPFDVVMLDIQLPGIDGLEVARRIRRLVPETQQPRIVAQTAQALKGDRENCLNAGMDDYLCKPFSPEALSRIVLG